ncbi:MAG TPA: UDP-glucose 4-epimerase GalE [Jatrophihabitantaceae bacterium]|nr:UDP-glucose 4-epimerase GalE [Jatrophihabitantaceae bacterium]
MRWLVTGGAGYIGSVVAAQLLSADHDVVVADDLSTGHQDAVPPGAAFHRCDVTEVGPLFEQWSFDGVLHFAARSIVGESVTDPALYWRNNVGGTLALLDTMRAHDVSRIVFSSTAATYGDSAHVPIDESAPTIPTSPYGAGKLAIDLALADHARAYGMCAVSLRYFNVAGALLHGQVGYGERHRPETHLIPLALRSAAGEAGPLQLFGTDYPTPDGTCIRDYVHVVDLADAHIRALSVGHPGEHRVINLGSGSGSSVREVLHAVEKVTGRSVPLNETGRRAGDPAVLVASNTRAAHDLGWRPQRDLTQMVDDAWQFSRVG